MDCPQKKFVSFTVHVEAASDQGSSALQRVEMYNFGTGSYETIDTRQASSVDTSFDVPITSNASRFVDAGSGLVKLRIGWKSDNGPRLWSSRIDQLRLINVVPDWNL